MLSQLNNMRLLMSFVLIYLFAVGGIELRLCLAAFLSWGIGGAILVVAHRHHCRIVTFAKVYAVFVAVSFLALAAFNDLFWYNMVGRLLDLVIARDPYDPDVPGSGFIDLCETFWQRQGPFICDLVAALWAATKVLLCMVVTPPIVAFLRWQRRELIRANEMEVAFREIEEESRRELSLPPRPPPKRDDGYRSPRRFNVVGDSFDAVSRRRGLSKEFA